MQVTRFTIFSNQNQNDFLFLCSAPGGDCQSLLEDDIVPFEEDAKGFLRQILEALDFIHERNIVHLDIKVGIGNKAFLVQNLSLPSSIKYSPRRTKTPPFTEHLTCMPTPCYVNFSRIYSSYLDSKISSPRK